MAVELSTTYLGLVYPTAGNNGSNFAAGIADMAIYLDGVIPVAMSDIVLPGVTTTTAAVVSNPAVSGAGAVSYTSLAGGVAYILATAGVLTRNSIPTGSFSATPSLPASGKFATVGIDLVFAAWGAAASVVLSAKGADQNTAALALAAPPALATGHLRIMNLVIQNSGGTYSLASSLDVRTFTNSRSRFASQTTTTTGLNNTSLAVPANACTVNFSLSAAAIIQVVARAAVTTSGTGSMSAALFLDGASILDVGLGGSIAVTQTVGSIPNYIFATGSVLPGGLISGSSTTPAYVWNGSAAQFVGSPISLFIPAGTHRIQWAFSSAASVPVYNVISQQIAVNL